MYILFFTSLLLTVLWYYHATIIGSNSGGMAWHWSGGGDAKWGNLDMMFGLHYYDSLFNRIGKRQLTLVGSVLMISGLFSFRKSYKGYLFHLWFLAVFIFFMLVPHGNIIHDYYQMPLIPIASIFIGNELAQIYNGTSLFNAIFLYRHKEVLTVALVIAISLISYKYSMRLYNKDTFWPYYFAAEAVKETTEDNSLIITMHTSRPEILYYSNRKGWHLNPRETPAAVENLRKAGADYFVSIRHDLFNMKDSRFIADDRKKEYKPLNTALKDHLVENYTVTYDGKDEDFIIFTLKDKV